MYKGFRIKICNAIVRLGLSMIYIGINIKTENKRINRNLQ